MERVCGSCHCIKNDNTESVTFPGTQLQWCAIAMVHNCKGSPSKNEFPSIVLEIVALSSSLWHSVAIAIIAMRCIFKIVVIKSVTFCGNCNGAPQQ